MEQKDHGIVFFAGFGYKQWVLEFTVLGNPTIFPGRKKPILRFG